AASCQSVRTCGARPSTAKSVPPNEVESVPSLNPYATVCAPADSDGIPTLQPDSVTLMVQVASTAAPSVSSKTVAAVTGAPVVTCNPLPPAAITWAVSPSPDSPAGNTMTSTV